MQLKSKLHYFTTMHLGSVLRFIYLKIVGKDTLVTGSCNCCGECCRLINLRAANGWIRSRKHFNELVEKNSEYSRFVIVSQDTSGYLLFNCSWLQNDGNCRDYKQRLAICRNYPNKSMVLCGGKPLPQCGYVIKEVVPFKKYLDSEMKKTRK